MTSKLAVPEVGNTVIIQVETKNHQCTIVRESLITIPRNPQCMELGGIIEEIAGGYVHFALDSIHLTRSLKVDNLPRDGRIWRQPEAKPLKMGVPTEMLKVFNENDDDVAWIMNL